MAKYRFLRDRAANGTAPNTAVAPAGQIAPSNLYLTKQFKKGDVVDGVVSGNSITIQVNDAKQTTGQPYSGTVNLTTTISDNRYGVTTYWMEALDANGNAVKNSNTSTSFVWTPMKKVLSGVLVIGAIFGILKLTKDI